MSVFIYANPGQIVSLVLQTLDTEGQRADPPSAPQIDSLYTPDLAPITGYPQDMTKLSTGLWTYKLTITSNASSLGTHIASATWNHPTSNRPQYEIFQIHVVKQFGTFSVT